MTCHFYVFTVELNLRLHAQHPILLEFDIYPIDIYRQKTDEDFIGTLDIYEINKHAMALKSSSSTLVILREKSSKISDLFRLLLLFRLEHRLVLRSLKICQRMHRLTHR